MYSRLLHARLLYKTLTLVGVEVELVVRDSGRERRRVTYIPTYIGTSLYTTYCMYVFVTEVFSHARRVIGHFVRCGLTLGEKPHLPTR